MKALNSDLKIGLIIVLAFALLGSCKPVTQPDESSGKKDKNGSKVTPLQVSGKYHYLYCTKAEFNALGKRSNNGNKGQGLLILKNNISGTGITLHGWSYKTGNTPFSEEPNIKFSIDKDTLSFKSGSYVGDFILAWKDVKDIQNMLGPSSKFNFVVFQPFYTNTTNTQIAYQIHLSPSPTQANIAGNEKFALTGKILNPIPPGGGNAFDE